ncbi:MAG: carbohydrate ABC transporter permease, partial [Clostridium sp.]
MKRRKKQLSAGNRVFYIFNTIFWMIVMVLILYPLYLVVIASVSDPDAIVRGEVIWHPVDFS